MGWFACVHAGYSNTTISSHRGDGKGGENEMVVDSSKFTKGKGPYGGANVAHHPRPKNGAESLSKTPYIYISATINFYLSFVLLLVPSFWLLRLRRFIINWCVQ